MEKIKNLESYESYKISRQAAEKITGSRTKYYSPSGGLPDSDLSCAKFIDDRFGRTTKFKFAERFEDRC
tara:strand:- start:27181 stop:27387 length:207 start_codon:yes stop_codon:yes gene_type:complete